MTVTLAAPRADATIPEVVTSRSLRTLPALERELQDGLLTAWKQLVQDDPHASCFQSPGWCLPWYRSYHDEFDPYVLVVSSGEQPVGIVPLSVRRTTGEIAFASGAMADYRDIVALPDYRRAVVAELLRVYLAGRFPNPLQIGWIDPASDTPSVVIDACRSRRVPYTAWRQPCYRWFPVDGENLNKKFSRVRTHLNHFKRLGNVTFDVIDDPQEWTAFRDAFFQQHTLRQLQADRVVSFDDARKQRFYDRLFDSPSFRTHVTALRVDGELLSGHIGLVWRDVLMLGAPSISIEHEQRSPSLILLSWVMQNAGELGLRGFDLTVGDTEFKRRLGNQCVEAMMIEVYGRKRSYYARALRTRAVAAAKRAVARIAGDDAWKTRVKPAVERFLRYVAIARSEGLRAALHAARHRGTAGDAAPREIRADAFPQLESSTEAVAWQLRDNRLDDLLLAGPDAATQRAVRECARIYARRRASGAVLHTLVAGTALTAWCFARTSGQGDFEVSDLHVDAAWRAKGAETALLTRLARHVLGAGGTRLVIQAQ